MLQCIEHEPAAVVLGRTANGWKEWKRPDGRTLSEVKRVTRATSEAVLKNIRFITGIDHDQHDANCVARWVIKTNERGFLAQRFQPSLTEEERRVADLEGWIMRIR